MKLGTYKYKHQVGARDNYGEAVLTAFTLRVEILEERGERYRVRFMQYHADGRGPNTTSLVLKKNVIADDVAPREVPPLRLPYKD